MITAVVAAGAVWVCREPLVDSYTTDAAVRELALSLMALAMVFHVFDAMQGAAGLVLRGYKIAFAPMLIHSAALWGVGLLGGYALAYHSDFGRAQGGAAAFWTTAIFGIAMAGFALSWLASRVARRHAF
jgi:multidrug resistance protein, MATE family